MKDLKDYSENKWGRQRTTQKDDICSKVEGLITEDRHIKAPKIAEVTGISKSTVLQNIFIERSGILQVI